MALTKRQREVFDFIKAFVGEKGYSPSLEEICAHFGLSSVATVHKHVQHLVEKVFLRKGWNRSRSVEPMPEERSDGNAFELPLLGTVAAGALHEAIEQTGESVTVPREMVGRGESYVLQVRGDSMIEDHIQDGDYVVVESRSEARNGETVVALIRGEEVTLKKFYRRGPTVRLQPANSTMEDIVVPASDLEVRGVVCGLVRHY